MALLTGPLLRCTQAGDAVVFDRVPWLPWSERAPLLPGWEIRACPPDRLGGLTTGSGSGKPGGGERVVDRSTAPPLDLVTAPGEPPR
jgi:hypothetical protein